MELFIPTKINKDNVFAQGFGKKEFRRLAIVTVFALGFGLLIGIVFFNSSFQTVLIATIMVGLTSAVISYGIFVRNSINLSVYDYIQLLIGFLRNQQLYRYKKMKEWV